MVNASRSLVGAHFVTYEGEEEEGCILWVRPGQRKPAQLTLGWVVRFRTHPAGALLAELCVAEQR